MKSTSSDSLVEAWASFSGPRQKPAIFDAGSKVLRTFSQIDEEARDFEGALLSKLRPGEVIAIQIGNHAGWPALLLAALRRRLITLPLEQGMPARELNAALKICRAAAIVQTAGGAKAIDGPVTLRPVSNASTNWGPNPPSLLKLTSGTTAAPRAVRFRSEQLHADCTQICETMGITANDLNFGVIPLSHSYGFSNLVTPLLTRGVPMVLTRDSVPRALLCDLAQTNATVFPGMPIFYQAISEIEDVPALSRLRLCISAGAPLPLEIARKFREKFKRPIHSFYGSSECGGICYDRAASLVEQGFVGQPMLGVDLEPLDPEAPSTRIRIRSAAVGDGYFPEPDEEKLGRGKFVPDDLLSATPEGFRVVGRISDLINVAGKKVNPAEVEAELLRYAGVRAAVVFGRESVLRNQEVAACIVAGGRVREADLLEHCRVHLSGWQVPKRIFFVSAIPVNERGKINRRDLASKFSS